MENACQIDIINRLDQFSHLRRDWDKTYAADTEAMLYVSWSYLNAWFTINPNFWFILAVRDISANEYIGFLPLKKTSKGKFGMNFYSLLTMGTSPLPVYTGFVCLPDKFDDFSKAIASHFTNDKGWDKLFFSNVIDPRLDRLLENFDEKKFLVEKNQVLSSLRLSLPASYEEYLMNSFSRDSRKIMRRKIKRVEHNEDLKLTMSTNETIERDAEILIRMWRAKWGKDELAKIEHEIILRFFKENRCFLFILWHKNRPIASHSFLIDEQKSTLYAHLTVYDKDFSKISPGKVLSIKGIQTAIEKGYRYLDFAQGMDPYKLAFKAEQINVSSVRIAPKRLKNRIFNLLKA